jgi:hypothetical protein
MKTTTIQAFDAVKDSLTKMREAEKNISEVDPSFKSSYPKQWFE